MEGAMEPVRNQKLADAIAEHLEQLILEGALRPGEKLAALARRRPGSLSLKPAGPGGRRVRGRVAAGKGTNGRPAHAAAAESDSEPWMVRWHRLRHAHRAADAH